VAGDVIVGVAAVGVEMVRMSVALDRETSTVRDSDQINLVTKRRVGGNHFHATGTKRIGDFAFELAAKRIGVCLGVKGKRRAMEELGQEMLFASRQVLAGDTGNDDESFACSG
jgi:hypothetical protein